MKKKEVTILTLELEDSVQAKNSSVEPGEPEGTITPVSASARGHYELNAVNRFSEDIQGYERFYEIYNTVSGVVEARFTANLVSALITMDTLDEMLDDVIKGKGVPRLHGIPTLPLSHDDDEGGGSTH